MMMVVTHNVRMVMMRMIWMTMIVNEEEGYAGAFSALIMKPDEDSV